MVVGRSSSALLWVLQMARQTSAGLMVTGTLEDQHAEFALEADFQTTALASAHRILMGTTPLQKMETALHQWVAAHYTMEPPLRTGPAGRRPALTKSYDFASAQNDLPHQRY